MSADAGVNSALHLGELDAGQLSEMLGVSRRTISNWCRFQGLPHAKHPINGRLGFVAADVADWLVSHDLPVPEDLME